MLRIWAYSDKERNLPLPQRLSTMSARPREEEEAQEATGEVVEELDCHEEGEAAERGVDEARAPLREVPDDPVVNHVEHELHVPDRRLKEGHRARLPRP